MRPHARVLLATALTVVLAAGTTALVAQPASSATWAPRTTGSFNPARDLEEFEARILVRANKVRARRGLPKVRVFQSCLDGYAERWASRLKDQQQLQHRNLGVVLDGCNLNWVGENLVRGTGLTPRAAIRAWMNSPGHREILTKRRAVWAGIGVRSTSSGTIYAVLNFGDRS